MSRLDRLPTGSAAPQSQCGNAALESDFDRYRRAKMFVESGPARVECDTTVELLHAEVLLAENVQR